MLASINYTMWKCFSSLFSLFLIFLFVLQQAPTGNASNASYEEIKLRVGVPRKNGFQQFVHVIGETSQENYNISGYCMEVFNAVITHLPFKVSLHVEPHDIDSSEGSGYDALLKLIPSKVSRFHSCTCFSFI